MSLTNVYKDTYEYTRIQLEPRFLNSDIENNKLNILIKKVEGKCNKNGYIDKVYMIEESKDGMLYPENLSGAPIFDIKYKCRIYCPIEKTTIIGQVLEISDQIIICRNGPINIFITPNKLNTSVWKIGKGFEHKKKGRKLKKQDYVKIYLIDKVVYENNTQIQSLGEIIDFAEEKEVEEFFVMKKEEESNFF